MRITTALLVLLGCSTSALALFGEFPNDKPFKSEGYHSRQIVTAINGAARVYGWGTGDAGVFFFFKDDISKLNDFLVQLTAAEDTSVHVIFEPDEGRGEKHSLLKSRTKEEAAFEFNWSVNVRDQNGAFIIEEDGTKIPLTPRWVATVHIHLAGTIDLAKLKLPTTCTASISTRLDRFVRGHESRRKQLMEDKKDLQTAEPSTEEMFKPKNAFFSDKPDPDEGDAKKE
ncbi:MAG: hypothetical protein WD768_18580 [Phycisphaeraceae bacterium]